MDFNIAKRNLIILLIILNLVLIVSIYQHNNKVSIDNPYFSTEALDNFYRLLEAKNIILEAELPKSYENMEIVDFEYEPINNKSFPSLFEELKEIESSNNFKKAVVKIPYDDILIKRKYYKISEYEDRLDFSKEFLGIYFSNFKFDLKLIEEDLIVYNPIIEGFIYEDSYVKFNFTEEAIFVEILKITPIEKVSARRNVVTPVEAILSLVPKLESGDTIKRIDLIYYFELNEEELYKVKNARALPSWRIITEDNKVFYVFALKE